MGGKAATFEEPRKTRKRIWNAAKPKPPNKGHPKDIERLLKTKPQAFRKSYSEYAHHKLYLGLVSTVTHQAIIDEAENAGIYLLGQQGERVEVMNQKVRAF